MVGDLYGDVVVDVGDLFWQVFLVWYQLGVWFWLGIGQVVQLDVWQVFEKEVELVDVCCYYDQVFFYWLCFQCQQVIYCIFVLWVVVEFLYCFGGIGDYVVFVDDLGGVLCMKVVDY